MKYRGISFLFGTPRNSGEFNENSNGSIKKSGGI
jgi:hypothetical protein